MPTIHNLATRFKLAADNFELLKQQALIETASVITEMTEDQMRHGIKSDGEEIQPDLQDKHYAMAKLEAGGLAPYKVPDLRNSGAFQAGLRTTVTDKALRTFSIDTKAQMLELGNGKRKGYGPLIYGATKENLTIYAKENLLPEIMDKLKKATVG